MKKPVLVTLLAFSGTLFGQHWPVSRAGEKLILGVTPEQVASLIPFHNYSESVSDGGVCYGIDLINLALLFTLRFEMGYVDRDNVIQSKLESAALGDPVTVYGFTSANDFFEKMKLKERVGPDPLRAAILAIQTDPKNLTKAGPRVTPSGIKRYLYRDGQQTMGKAVILKEMLDSGILPRLAVDDDRLEGHALRAVGYLQKNSEPYPSTFYVLDPNFPRQLKTLELRRFKGEGKQKVYSNEHWHYAPWRNAPVEKTKIEKEETEEPSSPLQAGLGNGFRFRMSWFPPSDFEDTTVKNGEIVIYRIEPPGDSFRIVKTGKQVSDE